MKKVSKLQFNWRQESWGGEAEENFEQLEVGKEGVTSIVEESTSPFNYLITFENGKKTRAFNPNYVEYINDELES